MSERIITLKDRTFTRTQGCWNCVHVQSANAFWSSRRQQDLQIALGYAMEHPEGESHPKVVNIRKMVDKIDNAVAVGLLRRCEVGRKPDGSNVADLVAHNFLCTKWSGAQGSSLARDPGRTDKLPEELAEDLDGGIPDLRELVGKKLI